MFERPRMYRAGGLVALGVGLLCASAAAHSFPGDPDDWPCWRGPERTGISSESGWSLEPRRELWKKNVGIGYSTVSVAGGHAFTQGHDKQAGLDTIWCFEAETGREVWSHSFACKTWAQAHGGGSLVTPTLDGTRLYTINREGHFLCLEVADGAPVWHKELKDELDVAYPTWGFAASPLIVGEDCYVNVGRIVCFDKQSGERRWTSENLGHAYATPTPFELDGTPALAVFNGAGFAVVSRAEGDVLARSNWKTRFEVNAASPVDLGEGRWFISSGYGRGCAMLKVSPMGVETTWESKVMRNHMAGCTYHDGHLYGFDESTLKCIGVDGEEKWRLRGLGKGAHAIADGKLIVLSSEGELIVADATPDAFSELSRQKVLDGGVYWTTPTLSHGLLYCRNSAGDLVCLDHRPAGAGSGAAPREDDGR